MVIIAFDYDETFTRDPLGWSEASGVLRDHGHTIIGATMRSGQELGDVAPSYVALCDQIVCTDREAKRPALARLGIFPHVWVDDTPPAVIATLPDDGDRRSAA